MDYEKKYKEALGWMQSVYPTMTGADKEDAEHFFPELKEAEDERIRKELIKQVVYIVPNDDETDNEGNVLPIYQQRIDKYIAWLEKQGEKIEHIEGLNTEFERQVSHLIASAINREHEYNEGYVKWTANALLNYAKHEIEKQGEQKPAWSEEDEWCLNTTIAYLKDAKEFKKTAENCIDWLNSLKDRYTWKPSKEAEQYEL